jgi:hypothetical protein
MSILDANLPQHPCYAKTSEGFEYLEFSCIARVPQLYTEYVMNRSRACFAKKSIRRFSHDSLEHNAINSKKHPLTLSHTQL